LSEPFSQNVGYVDIPAGQTFATVTITPVDDAIIEGTETATFTLQPNPFYDVGAPASVELNIRDNDATLGGSVVGRRVFYNQSAFDGNDPAAGASDDAAVAPDKTALMPSQSGTFANVTSYGRGLNGVMVDISGLPAGAGPSASDFAVKAGSAGVPADWADATPPSSVSVRRGVGAGGSDRVTLLWANGAVKNGWLQVTVLPSLVTGLTNPDVFYFGNLSGESGDLISPLRVSALDLGATKRELNQTVGIADPVDFNRDGRVNALDLGAVKVNLNRSLITLNAPAVAALAPTPLSPFVAAKASIRRVWDEAPADSLGR
jgi:hypothetical protein